MGENHQNVKPGFLAITLYNCNFLQFFLHKCFIWPILSNFCKKTFSRKVARKWSKMHLKIVSLANQLIMQKV